jgi:hypothetical protein
MLDLARGTVHGARRVTGVVIHQGRSSFDIDLNERGRIWAARVRREAEDAWKYVSLRRYILSLEHSLEQGLEWVVFEPNDEPLWARIRESLAERLEQEWRDSKLQGTTSEEAFYVRCDRSTMTQNDIDNGYVVAEIGIAPVRPAEFVILRIGQWATAAAPDEPSDDSGEDDA